MGFRSSIIGFCVLSVAAICQASPEFPEPGKNGYFQIGTDLDIGFNGGPTDSYFASDTADWFGPNWRGLQIPLENARSYEEHVNPFFTLSFRAGYKNFHVLLDLPLRRDLEAWYQDDLHKNFTYNPSELDINVPNNGYAMWVNPMGFVQFGRFAVDELKVSKNDILVGGAPYHDGLHWKFTPSIFRYDFLFSSLNAWLYGDVRGENGCPPVGTEAYAQKCTDPGNQVSNQRNRVYDDNIKTFMFHRFGIETSKLWIYVAEQSMIGGKAPEFRSMSPFIYWHDNYATGYTSAATSVAEAARELYLRSEEFARIVESCKYVYLEGHYVLDEPQYVKMDSHFRRYLTPYARKNIAECSLSFRIITRDSKIDYVFGAAAKSDKRDEYFNGYTFSAEPDTAARKKENAAYGECSERWCALAASFPEDNAGEAVKIAMKAMGVTQDVLASHLGVSRKTVNEWLRDKEMPVARVVGICVVLGMRMDASEALIEMAARPLKRSGVDALYRSFIATPGAITIARCNEILIEHHYPALNEGMNTEGMADCQWAC